MPPRTRTKVNTCFAGNLYPGQTTNFVERTSEYFHESKPVGPNNCVHYTYPVLSNTNPMKNGQTAKVINYPFPINFTKLHQQIELRKFIWEDLPSSSRFGLIQILAELDDTIAVFGKKFWKELSYGSVTWGLLPLISDAKAVIDTCNTLANQLDSNFENEFTYQLSDNGSSPSTSWTITGEAKVRYTGKMDWYTVNPADAALDFLGFHPDLSTAWDLVPYSFAIDYIFPIGDALDKLTFPGWVKTIPFKGWETVKINASYTLTWTDLKAYYYVKDVGTDEFTYFSRQFYDGFLDVSTRTPPLSITFPSFREMFNMMYLTAQKGGMVSFQKPSKRSKLQF